MKVLLILILPTALSACSDLGESPGDVYAVVDIQTIVITNTMEKPVYFLVMGGNLAMIANWTPFCNPNNLIQPGSTSRHDHSHMKEDGERFATIYWWTDCREVNGELRAQTFHSISVALP